MKNYWLDRKHPSFNVKAWEAIIAYKNNEGASDAFLVLQPIFKRLAESILRYTGKLFDDEAAVVEDCILMCFQKLHRFNSAKGKAFNFFTTIILCHMRQLYRTQKLHKEAHAKLLAGTKKH